MPPFRLSSSTPFFCKLLHCDVLRKLRRKNNARALDVHDEIATDAGNNSDHLAWDKAQVLKVVVGFTGTIVKSLNTVAAVVPDFRQNHDASFLLPKQGSLQTLVNQG